jgi:WD40 repeat protein
VSDIMPDMEHANIQPGFVAPPPRKRKTRVVVWVLVAVGVLGGLALLAAAVLMVALGLAWSGAFRDSTSPHSTKLPVLSESSAGSGGIRSIAVTDDENVWAYSRGGLGTQSAVYVRLQRDGEYSWDWMGELPDNQHILVPRSTDRPPANGMHAIREGADAMVYVPDRDTFVWTNLTSGRLLASAPRDTTFMINGHASPTTQPYSGGKVLYHFDLRPESLAVSPDAAWVAVGMETAPSYPDDSLRVAQASSHGSLVLLRWQEHGCEIAHDLKGHVGSVRACAFTPDGKFLVSGGNDSMVRVWSVADGQLVHEWRAEGPVTQVSATANADSIVYCSERGHIEVRTREGQLDIALTTSVVDPPSGNIRSFRIVRAAYSPDGKWVAVHENGSVSLWRAKGWTMVAQRRIEGTSPHACLSWSPSSLRLGVIGEGRAYVLGIELDD